MLEHPHGVLVVDAVSSVDHDGLVGGAKQEDVPTPRHLEAEDLDVVADRYALDVRVKSVFCGVPESSPGEQDALEDLSWVLTEIVEFLDDMVDILQEGEQELILGRPDQPPHRLGEPDIEDGVVEPLTGHVVLEDLETVL